MKTRLALFTFLLLALPYAGLLLSGQTWADLNESPAVSAGHQPALLTLLFIAAIFLTSHFLLNLRTGTNPLRSQRGYFLAIALAGGVLGGLLAYLNHYNAAWDGDNGSAALLVPSLLCAAAVPAVLSLRALLGSFGGLLKRLADTFALPAFAAETAVFILAPLALLGLIGGAVWTEFLFYLFWLSPLLLLAVLQLLWNESTIFATLDQGDWGRLVCAAGAGLLLGNLALLAFASFGGILNCTRPLLPQTGFALFGLLSLQLGDVLAEAWRGKTRADVFKKKTFPIPVVVKK